MIENADNIFEQLDNIFPSAKAPLYRRLMGDEKLTYLRERGGIVGFELDVSKGQLLAGFLLIAIQKHTIYAYRSDLDEDYKLVLFPPLDKMFDRTFEMLDLHVTKKLYQSDDFIGKDIKTGKLKDLARNLMPPEKDIDLSQDVSERMFQEMEKVRTMRKKEEPIKESVEVPVEEVVNVEDIPPMNEPPMNDFEDDGYDEFDDFEGGLGTDFDPFDEDDDYEDDIEEEIEEDEDWRIVELREKKVRNLADLGEFVEMRLNVPKAISTQVLNKALQSQVVMDKKMKSEELAKMLFEKLFEDGKL